MIVEKRQSIHVEMIINGKYKIFCLSVPEHMGMKELKKILIDNYKDFDKIEGTNLSDQFQNDVRVNRMSRNTPILSLI